MSQTGSPNQSRSNSPSGDDRNLPFLVTPQQLDKLFEKYLHVREQGGSVVAGDENPLVSADNRSEISNAPSVYEDFDNQNPISTKNKINAVFKAPQPLYNQNPSVWFKILEQQFSLSGIRSEKSKYSYTVGALDARLHNVFADLILRDKGINPYTTFKNEVIRVLGESESARVNNVLHGLSLGDRKPSQLLSEFRLNSGTTFSESALRQLWLQRLPQQIQMILSTFENDVSLTTLAERADKMLEVMSQSSLNVINKNLKTNSVPFKQNLNFQN